MARTARSLTEEELEERSILLREVKIGDLDVGPILKHVFIENHPEVTRVRFKSQENEIWMNEHKGAVVDMKVFPYEWEVGDRSGTVYYFRHATVRGSDAHRIQY